jgi:hypothetical protein
MSYEISKGEQNLHEYLAQRMRNDPKFMDRILARLIDHAHTFETKKEDAE